MARNYADTEGLEIFRYQPPEAPVTLVLPLTPTPTETRSSLRDLTARRTSSTCSSGDLRLTATKVKAAWGLEHLSCREYLQTHPVAATCHGFRFE